MGVPAAAVGRGQIKTLLVIGMAFLAVSPVIGQNASEEPSAVGVPTVVDESSIVLGESSTAVGAETGIAAFGFWDLARMILVLGCVVGIIYLVFYLLKKAGNGRFSETEHISIVGTQNLPGNRAIYLVRVGSQVFMVGAGGDSVTMLGEITEKETVDSVILNASVQGDAPKRNFGELISGIIKGNQDGTLNLMRQQRQRLERLRQ
jgi:flagellar protein FliO/FliZ